MYPVVAEVLTNFLAHGFHGMENYMIEFFLHLAIFCIGTYVWLSVKTSIINGVIDAKDVKITDVQTDSV